MCRKDRLEDRIRESASGGQSNYTVPEAKHSRRRAGRKVRVRYTGRAK
jgi:hypothetical protein